jgi:hypothetical protein
MARGDPRPGTATELAPSSFPNAYDQRERIEGSPLGPCQTSANPEAREVCMTSTSIQDAARFIDTVEFVEAVRSGGWPEPRPSIVPPLADEKAQGSVVSSNVITFPTGTSVAVREAVANWTLMAQLVASKAVKDTNAVRDWMDTYVETLVKSGWALREDAGSETVEGTSGSTVHDSILALITVALGPVPTALAIVTAALTSLQSMSKDSPWITLFDRRAKNASSAGFQIANCETEESGEAVLRGIEFIIEAHQELTQVLFFKFTNTGASVYKRARTLSLSVNMLQQLASKVEDRVLDQASANILAFDL